MKDERHIESNFKRSAIRALFIFHISYFIFSDGCAPSHKLTTTHPAPIPSPEVPAPSGTGKLPQPPTPAIELPLHISVVYPLPGQLRPPVDSNFIFGTAGRGDASLTINGHPVPLAKNGAFH